jgi:polyphosphate kinase 2 (PPK2 family)
MSAKRRRATTGEGLDMKIDTRGFRVREGDKVTLATWPTEVARVYKSKDHYRNLLAEHVDRLSDQQRLLYASNRHAILLIFQAMDAAGKDGVIKHVMSGVNPQGCQVFSFKHPSATELQHDFLWRTTRDLPERGRIGIFNRSYYEEVLHANGTRIVKFFLHLSKEEQRKRFLQRIDEPDKNWKFSQADIEERAYWRDYMLAYEKCLGATSTNHAPWYVVPADDKENARLIVSQVVLDTLESLKMSYPETTEARRRELLTIREQLTA